MEAIRNLKMLLTVSIALLLGAVGISNLAQIDKISFLNQEKIALTESNSAEVCSIMATENNPTLFISCGGFLE